MKVKPITPYERLKRIAREWADSVIYAHRRVMLTYKNASNQSACFRLDELYERTIAAEQLGYDVLVTAVDGNLVVQYRKKAPDVPWEIRP